MPYQTVIRCPVCHTTQMAVKHPEAELADEQAQAIGTLLVGLKQIHAQGSPSCFSRAAFRYGAWINHPEELPPEPTTDTLSHVDVPRLMQLNASIAADIPDCAVLKFDANGGHFFEYITCSFTLDENGE